MIQKCLKDEKVDLFVKNEANVINNQRFLTTEKILIFLQYFQMTKEVNCKTLPSCC